MEISPFQMLQLVVASLGFGVFMGIVNDLHRILRILLGLYEPSESAKKLYEKNLPIIKKPLWIFRWKKGKRIGTGLVLFFQDLFFWCMTAVGLSVLNYTFNDGKIRLYSVLGVTVGFLVYYCFIGKIAFFLCERLLFLILASFSILFFILLRPISKTFSLFYKKVNKLYKKIHKALEKRKKKVYNLYVVNSTLDFAKKGFINHKK